MIPQNAIFPSLVNSPFGDASTSSSPGSPRSSTTSQCSTSDSRAQDPAPEALDLDCIASAYGPPCTPMTWSWVCHRCSTRFPLGATQRCLFDGHRVCFGKSMKRFKKKKKSLGCGTEFDYIGWQEWLLWKRNRPGLLISSSFDQVLVDEDAQTNRDCWALCRFPGECHRKARNSAVVATVEEEVRPQTSLTIDVPVRQIALNTNSTKDSPMT